MREKLEKQLIKGRKIRKKQKVESRKQNVESRKRIKRQKNKIKNVTNNQVTNNFGKIIITN